MAALTLARIIPAVSVEVRPSESRKRFIVYSEKQVENPQMPIEWLMEVRNQQVFGNIPRTNALAENAVVGFVDVKSEPYVDTSIWNRGCNGQLCRVVYSRIFDTPLRLSLDDLDNQFIEQLLAKLPVYSLAMTYEPLVIGSELEVPVNNFLFSQAATRCELTLDLTCELSHLVLDKNGELRQFCQLCLTCGNRRRVFKFSGEITIELNEDYEPVLYPSVTERCGFDIRKQLTLHCGLPLDV